MVPAFLHNDHCGVWYFNPCAFLRTESKVDETGLELDKKSIATGLKMDRMWTEILSKSGLNVG